MLYRPRWQSADSKTPLLACPISDCDRAFHKEDLYDIINDELCIEYETLPEDLPELGSQERPCDERTESQSSPRTQTTSDDTISFVSCTEQTPEFQDLPVLVLGDRGEEIKKHIVGFFERLIDLQLGVSHRQNGQHHHGSGKSMEDPGHSSSSASNSMSDAVGGSKRCRHDGEDADNPEKADDDNEKDNPDKKRLKAE